MITVARGPVSVFRSRNFSAAALELALLADRRVEELLGLLNRPESLGQERKHVVDLKYAALSVLGALINYYGFITLSKVAQYLMI